MLRWENKDPDANINYGVDWEEALSDGDTILQSEWSCDDADLAIGTSSIAGSVCSVWLSGGVDGVNYEVRNKITTYTGMIDERTIAIRVKER